MKTKVGVLVVVALAVVFGAGGWAQAQEVGEEWEFAPHERYIQADLPRLEKAYLYALDFPLEGIVESTLREVARVKVAHLDWEADNLVEKLDEIARDGMTPALRYKASLVKALFETPALFASESGRDFRTPSQLYHAVARRLETDLLAGK
jgi:hypothetical protein